MKRTISQIRQKKPGHFGLAHAVELHFDWPNCARNSLPIYPVMNTGYKGFKTMH